VEVPIWLYKHQQTGYWDGIGKDPRLWWPKVGYRVGKRHSQTPKLGFGITPRSNQTHNGVVPWNLISSCIQRT